MIPLDTKVPSLPKNDSKTVAKKYITEAITYVQLHWSNNLQPIDQSITIDSIHFPITHKTATEWLKHFCKSRFDLFGKYEDSIDSKPRNFLFHSAISPMLNLGLITPKQVIDIVTKYYTAHKTAIGIANYEAFIRQVIGWREYQRYIYQYAGDKMRGSNHFDNNKRLNQHWYNATLGVKPVDDAVKMAINDGYIHHILRLMVVGNFMNLVGIHPDDVYKWFMEFSLDSYDWVMVGNVYSMALWADGGLTMRKPYISGDGYIMKMSNYKKEASTGTTVDKMGWNDKWNVVFHHFIDRNAEKLEKTYYNGLVKAWKRKSEKEKNAEMDKANEIIKSIVI
jgi:deoxyribodipyrimidine photolyase-related protein